MITIAAGIALILVGVLVTMPQWAMIGCIVIGLLVLFVGAHNGGYIRR